MKITGVALLIAVVTSVVFVVACGGGKDTDTPPVAVKEMAPAHTPEPTSYSVAVSPQPPMPPSISMVLETVSPEFLSCVKTILGDEQYNAIISGSQDAVAEQLSIVLPCILQYPQEANAIVEMFGLDMREIIAENTPIPDTQSPGSTQPARTPRIQSPLPTTSKSIPDESKFESGVEGDQVDVEALIQKAKNSPEILACLESEIGRSALIELTTRVPTFQESEIILSCFEGQEESAINENPDKQPQALASLVWPEDVGINHFGKLGDQVSEWEGGWIRPHAGRFIWGLIEPTRGQYSWTFTTDRQVEKWQNDNLAVLVTIWPFAIWDQDSCNSDRPEAVGMFPGMGTRLYSPCSKEAYADWLTAAVERYDGDGIDDMPGLKYPIRHWEVLNEPAMQGPELTFYQEDSQSYLELLELSYRAIKSADLDSVVLLGGQAGMQPKFADYWQPILRGAAGYFDIGNIHSIRSNALDFFASAYRDFLDYNGFETASFWVTEALIGTPPGEQKLSEDELARRTMTSYASSFAAGADIVFNVGGHDPTGGPGHLSAKTVELMAQEFGRFDTVSQLDDSLIEFGMLDGSRVFVLWDNAVLPSTVTGKVTIIDYLGNESTKEAIAVSGESPRMAIVDSRP